MSPGHESIRHILSHVLTWVSALAPLSIIIAALSFLNTLRQRSAKRDEDEAKAAREVLNKAGTKAYLLNWSLIGKMEISAGVLQIRELIEARVGKTPAAADLAALLGEQNLMEAIVEKGWRDSGAIAKFRQEALEFGQIGAEVGERIPLVQEALEVISARLRTLFLLDTFVVVDMRDKHRYRGVTQPGAAGPAEMMANLHRQLLRAASVPDKGSFSEACTLLERLSGVTATAPDASILRMLRSRYLFAGKFKSALEQRRRERANRRIREELGRRFREKFPSEAPLLDQATDALLRNFAETNLTQQRLEHSAERIVHIFGGAGGGEKLTEAVQKFLVNHTADETRNMGWLKSLLRLKYAGVTDPDVDMHLGTGAGVLKLLQMALDRGGDQHISVEIVLDRHKGILSDERDGWSALLADAQL
jgi:hypothetical protein